MDIAKRFENNPLLKPGDIKPSTDGMKVECLLNPGVFEFEGKIWLILRVAERPVQKKNITSLPIYNEKGELQVLEFNNDDPDLDISDPRVINYKGTDYLTTISHLRLVCSNDGESFSEPKGYLPLFGEGKHESYGIEDCRVTKIKKQYYLTFTEVSPYGVGVGLRTTTDWKNFEKHGMIFSPHNKDCAIFNRKINNLFYAFHRPSSPELGGNFIWMAQSKDRIYWGNHQCIICARPGMWDSARVGAGAAPILTEHGWLEIYHGANEENRYCLGAFLLDKDNPYNVIARSNDPIMEPVMNYEKKGFFGNVIFTNGHIVRGDEIIIYYGASDEVICMAKLSVSEILKSLFYQIKIQ